MNSDNFIYVPDINNETTMKREAKEEAASMWSLAYYTRFFEITTAQVLTRLMWSMFPKPGIDYFKDFIQSNPDLYGPIWISLTLIFTVTISGNLGSYLSLEDTDTSWKYDFHLISLAATCILSYCWLLPLALWAFIKWTSGDQSKVSYLELTCVYGYCITVFIPVSILWLIQIKWLQWLLACVAALLSGSVLIKSILPLTSSNKYVYMFCLFCCHFLLSLSLLWNFFQSSSTKSNVIRTTPLSH